MKIRKSQQESIDRIQQQITRLSEIKDSNLLKALLKDIERELEGFLGAKMVSRFKLETVYQENEFSVVATQKSLEKAQKNAVFFLVNLLSEFEINSNKTGFNDDDWLTEEIALCIIRRILNNFYYHIEAMYEANVHGKAFITKEKLDGIKIGNEYDVQRILYSLVKPVFPEARLEVTDDTGYGSIRYDIIIDKYNTVIEVKCSRASMTKKKLTEEVASDAFHYKYANIFFFLYDKHKIIDNKTAFIVAYSKIYNDKKIETVIIQPISL
ncbi:hypothetical protein [Sporosarcina limicola]|uniref:Uncharacterized protein n=1 Tax=Sporosarcina limicola TaxID=34101 RepID=A0A927MMH0_9BACL|nr:hypothetical protein [Sporosarcina limicola]MBE1556701.1 hypothetical protein [Sporosarcina limicola]